MSPLLFALVDEIRRDGVFAERVCRSTGLAPNRGHVRKAIQDVGEWRSLWGVL